LGSALSEHREPKPKFAHCPWHGHTVAFGGNRTVGDGDGDPTRLERLAVRFAVPAFLDRDLTVRIYELGDDTVIRNGLAVLR
jgi:hypothetical protein